MGTFRITGNFADVVGAPPAGDHNFLKLTPISQLAVSGGKVQTNKPEEFSVGADGSIGVDVFDNGVGYHLELHVTGADVVKRDIACVDFDLASLVLPLDPIDFDALGILNEVAEVTTATYDLQLTDVNRAVPFTVACVVTIPKALSAVWPDGGETTLVMGAGPVQVVLEDPLTMTLDAPFGDTITQGRGAEMYIRKRPQAVAPYTWKVIV